MTRHTPQGLNDDDAQEADPIERAGGRPWSRREERERVQGGAEPTDDVDDGAADEPLPAWHGVLAEYAAGGKASVTVIRPAVDDALKALDAVASRVASGLEVADDDLAMLARYSSGEKESVTVVRPAVRKVLDAIENATGLGREDADENDEDDQDPVDDERPSGTDEHGVDHADGGPSYDAIRTEVLATTADEIRSRFPDGPTSAWTAGWLSVAGWLANESAGDPLGAEDVHREPDELDKVVDWVIDGVQGGHVRDMSVDSRDLCTLIARINELEWRLGETPRRVLPLKVATCSVHGPHGGNVTCADCPAGDEPDVHRRDERVPDGPDPGTAYEAGWTDAVDDAVGAQVWAAAPLQWDQVRPGDVVVTKPDRDDPSGVAWMVLHNDEARRSFDRRVVLTNGDRAENTVGPTDVVQVLMPAGERAAIMAIRQGLDAHLTGRDDER